MNLTTGAVDATKNVGQVGRVDGFIGGAKQWEQRYGYDSLARLDISAEHRGDNAALVYRADYDYDRYGNRLQSGGQNLNLQYTPVVAADISTATNRFTSNTSYDAAGNVTADNKFRAMQYQYDAVGRMKWAALLDTTAQSTAVYDGQGRRVQTAVGAAVRHLVYDISGRVVAEYEPSSGGWKRDHIYRGGELLVTEESGGAKRYVLSDRQGSTRLVIDGSAAVVARHDYLPFGEEINAGVGMRTTAQGYGALHSLRQRYAGTERDDGTGLEHTPWRKLEAKAGRWTSPDPYRGSMRVGDPQSFNRYSYVQNDPVNFTDPSGLRIEEWHWTDYLFSAEFGGGGWAGGGGFLFGGSGFIGMSAEERAYEQRVTNAFAGYGFNTTQEVVAALGGGEVNELCLGGSCWYDGMGTVTTIGTAAGQGYGNAGLFAGAVTVSLIEPTPIGELLILGGLAIGVYAASQISTPYFEARSADLRKVDYIADKYGVDRKELGRAVHDYKKGLDRGEDLTEEEMEMLAQSILANGGKWY